MRYRSELYHHGVKGMQWGKRNGPPYPLYRKTSYYKEHGTRPPGYTGDKKGAVGGIRDTVKRSAENGQQSAEQIKKQASKMSDEQNMARVNSSFSEKRTEGNTQNCIACSVTMEARKRGLDVVARTDLAHDDDPDTCFDAVAKVYKGAKTTALGTDAKTGTSSFNSYYTAAEKLARRGNNKELCNKLTSTTSGMPKGSRGQIVVMFDRYSGHSMYFSKGANGKTTYYDTQRNRTYTEEQMISQLVSSSSNIILQRFDNCDIDYKQLRKYSK